MDSYVANRPLWRAISSAMFLLGSLSACSSASADCARLSGCGASPQTNALVRKVNYGQVWSYAPVPDSPQILFDTQRWREVSQAAIDVFAGLNEYMPYDFIEQDPYGGSDFTWYWTSQQTLQQIPGRRTGIPVGATQPNPDMPDHPCRIRDANIWFAFDPNDGYAWFCWGDPDCFTPTCYSGFCGFDMLDYFSAAVHEYGHALGLGHSDDGDATMYAVMLAQDTVGRALKGCEATFVAAKYRDNFGPSVLRSFEVERVSATGLALEWLAEVEVGCRAYRVTRQCPDGSSTLIADSVLCEGPGHSYALVDAPPCNGVVTYTLSLVDSAAMGMYEEVVLLERRVDTGGGMAQLAVNGVRLESVSAPVGFGTPSAAVEALGAAISGRDDELRNRALADGFGYITKSGLYWGRAIDGILEGAMRACLSASDTTLDSLRFVGVSTRALGENLVEVTAEAQYAHRCLAVNGEWVGRVVAIVERRRPEEGWKVRQVVEAW